MTDAFDAIVIGSGPNGLVAANVLADHGWSVLVLEAQPTPGGAVRSDRELHPDFVHDTFSAFYPLAAASQVMKSLELEKVGLEWVHAPAVLGNPLPSGAWAMLYRDIDSTAQALEAAAPGDGERWRRLCDMWSYVGDSLVECLTTPFPPVRGLMRLVPRIPGSGGLQFVRLLLEPANILARTLFKSDQAQMLLMGNAGHSDIPLDAPGSGLMALLMAMMAQFDGFPVPRGGAGELSAALCRRLEQRGGEIRTSSHVDSIVLDGRRAVGVVTAGDKILANRGVIATTVATQLYGGLIPTDRLSKRVVRGMSRFTMDPSTIKVDWALSGPAPWSGAPAVMPGTVHVADSPEKLMLSLQQLSVDHVPADPFLLVGQMTTTDPTRSPAGTESMWAYTHAPQNVAADAGEGIRGVWDHDDCERMADRMQARIERYAPGFGERIIARRVLGPRQLAERDENLVGGAINGGTSSLHQQLIFRPVPGSGRAETAFAGLFLGSASAHPGGGVHGAAGANAARAAIAQDRLRRLRP